MPLDIYDVRDKCEVLHPNEIAAGEAQYRADNIDYIPQLGAENQVIPLATFVAMLKARYQRACATARVIAAIQQGYCTIEDKAAAPASDARH
jgi:hypothetical protein